MERFSYKPPEKNLDLSYHLFPPTRPSRDMTVFCVNEHIYNYMKVMFEGLYEPFAINNDVYLTSYIIYAVLKEGELTNTDRIGELMSIYMAIYWNVKIITEHRPTTRIIIDPVHWVVRHLHDALSMAGIHGVKFPSRPKIIRDAVKYAAPDTEFVLVKGDGKERRHIARILNSITELLPMKNYRWKKIRPIKKPTMSDLL